MAKFRRKLDRLIELENLHCGQHEGIRQCCEARVELLEFVKEEFEGRQQAVERLAKFKEDHP